VERLQRIQELREKQKADHDRLMRLVSFSRGHSYSFSNTPTSLAQYAATAPASDKFKRLSKMSSSMSTGSSGSSNSNSDSEIIDLVSDDETSTPTIVLQRHTSILTVTTTDLDYRTTSIGPVSQEKTQHNNLFRWLNKACTTPIEVVDLASDEESAESDKCLLLPNYPQLLVTVSVDGVK